MIISHSRQFVFLHIHKTAGESITATLRPVLSGDDLMIRGNATISANGTVLTKHSTAREVRNALQSEAWNRYFTFAFVRHPIDRALSLYRYTAQRSRPPKLTTAQRLGLRPAPDRADRSQEVEMRAYRATDSVSEFIRHPLLEESRSMKPQSTSLCDEEGNLLVNYVGRFERLSADLAYVEQTLGLACLRLKWQNASRGPQMLPKWHNAPRKRRTEHDELSSDDRAYLTARFEDDFKRFGYEP